MISNDALAIVAAAVATVAGSAWAGRYAGRSAIKTAKVTAEGEKDAAEVTAESEAFTRAAKIYQGSIEQLTRDVEGARQEATRTEKLRAKDAAGFEERLARIERSLNLHRVWDQEAVTEVNRLGGNLRPPPNIQLEVA